MKRPLKPVRQSADEKRRERRFTRRMMALALAGGLFGSCVNLMRSMGTPVSPRPPGQVAIPPCLAERPPRLPGK